MWLQNLRYAFRKLAKSPSFAFTAVLTLGIGIGANTVAFTVVHDVLLKPLPYRDPQQLVTIEESITSGGAASFAKVPVNANHLVFWQEHSRTFSAVGALLIASMPVSGERTEEIAVARQTANLFTVLGVSPQRGRTFRAEENNPGHNKVVILTDAFWKRRFNADPSIVGKKMILDGGPYEVVGVLPAGLILPASKSIGGGSKPVEAFVPFGWDKDVLAEIEGDHNYFGIGRVKPGFTLEQARAELNTLQGAISQRTPDKVHYGAIVTPFQDYVTASSRRSLLLLLGAVGAVLLISCINIANLLLARASSNTREAAVRTALGASARQLALVSFAEPLILSSLGCALGVAIAANVLPVLLHNARVDLPFPQKIQMDWIALAFAAGLSFFVAVLCGLLPAWRSATANPEQTLRSETRKSSEPRSAKRLRSGLVVGEVAGSMALVTVAGLFLVSIVQLLQVERGFQSEHVVSADILLPDVQYGAKAKRNAFYAAALAQLRTLPGVTTAAVISVLPLDGDRWGDLVSREGETRPLWERPQASFRWTSPGYFETLQVPLLAGRLLTDNDQNRSVALVSAQIARTVWPGQSAIGQRFKRGDPDEKPLEVIGVVGDLRGVDLSQRSSPMVYVPYWYRSQLTGSIVVRTGRNQEQIASAIRNVISKVDSQAAVTSVRTMDEIVSGSLATRRFEVQLLMLFAATALLLAGLGIYGVVTYSSLQRTHEIGIRMALGADASDVRRLVILEGMRPVLLGTAIGIGCAWLCGRLVSTLLYQVSAFDPAVAAGAGAVLLLVAMIACLLPARRATAIEPLVALHHE